MAFEKAAKTTTSTRRLSGRVDRYRKGAWDLNWLVPSGSGATMQCSTSARAVYRHDLFSNSSKSTASPRISGCWFRCLRRTCCCCTQRSPLSSACPIAPTVCPLNRWTRERQTRRSTQCLWASHPPVEWPPSPWAVTLQSLTGAHNLLAALWSPPATHPSMQIRMWRRCHHRW